MHLYMHEFSRDHQRGTIKLYIHLEAPQQVYCFKPEFLEEGIQIGLVQKGMLEDSLCLSS